MSFGSRSIRSERMPGAGTSRTAPSVRPIGPFPGSAEGASSRHTRIGKGPDLAPPSFVQPRFGFALRAYGDPYPVSHAYPRATLTVGNDLPGNGRYCPNAPMISLTRATLFA